MVIMKIPILYLCWVVYWAIKAEPRPDQPAVLVAATDDSDPTPWRPRSQPRTPGPGCGRRGGGVLRRRHGRGRGHEPPPLVTTPAATKAVVTDVDGLNSGFARDLLEEYLENPDAVPSEWRRLFESGQSDIVATH